MQKLKMFLLTFALAALILLPVPAFAVLTPGASYTITLEAITSSGTLTSAANNNSLNVSTRAVADSSGKISFSLSGVPTTASYNFLVITITDSSGTIVRRSLVPAPVAGQPLSMGISEVTNSQTQAFINVCQNAATDDPILIFFGYLLVRSSDVTAGEIEQMANFCIKGIKGTDGSGLTTGFEASLRSQGATSAMLASFRSNIVINLSGYASLFKDSVDQYFSLGAETERERRGEAAGKLFEYLVDAANSAGMKEEWLIMAFEDMGIVVLPLIDTAIANGTIRRSVEKSISASIDRGLQKIRANNYLRKYTDALTILGASAAEIAQYNTAATTLMNTMATSFQDFERKMGDQMPDATTIEQYNNEMQTAMQTAFNQFMTDSAASDAQIADLISRLKTALNLSDLQASQWFPAARFKWYTSGGTQINWPVTLVVSVRWVTTVLSGGGSLTYTRDTTAIPSNMSLWFGQCSNNQYWDQASCVAGGGTWTVARHNFTTIFPSGNAQSWAALEGLREDINIAENTKWAAFQNISPTDKQAAMNASKTAEAAFYTLVETLKSNIGGTSNGTTALADAVKKALITVCLSPSF